VSRQEKALKRLLSKPTDFTWGELKAVMESLGYELKTTGGSGRKFVKPEAAFAIHEPHPYKLLKAYQIRKLIAFLKKEGDIE
jgi:predicted RNA binding protein YcfA (HicA-like mRNA interferase family)